jgi:phenylpropionate dioxygenase-like ring-hydroxylating dioxygenase large terminal subunit
VFRGNWLMAGSSADLERRQGGHQNNFYTLSLAGMPLLVARGADGRLRAFHNARPHSSCQHSNATPRTSTSAHALDVP